MTNYFDDKSGQVSIDSMVSFGIPISSRYSKAGEIAEMLIFTEELARESIDKYVHSVFYDSKADICSFELASTVSQYDPIALKIEEIANRCLSQYELFGSINHGLMTSS